MKIAVIGPRGIPATYGGIEKHCEELYSELVNLGYEVTLYARDYYTVPLINEFKGIKVKNIKVINVKGFETLLYSFISTILATFSDVDIIHFHAQGPAIFCFIPKLLSPKKRVGFTCHGIDWQRDKWSFFAKKTIQLGEFCSAKFTDFRIMVSNNLQEYYLNRYQVTSEVIYNGITKLPKIPLNEDKRKLDIVENSYFLFVGRLVPEKSTETIIMAFKKLVTDKKLVIVGDSAGTNTYVNYLKTLSKSDKRILFVGYKFGEDLIQLYSNALAYISSSRLEGLPITVLEALSYTLPLLLSDIPPHKEILDLDRRIGIMFKTDDIDDCLIAIKNMIDKKPLEYEGLESITSELIDQYFNWQKIALKTKVIYEKSLRELP